VFEVRASCSLRSDDTEADWSEVASVDLTEAHFADFGTNLMPSPELVGQEWFFDSAHTIGQAVDSRCGFLGLWCGAGSPTGKGSSEGGARIRSNIRRRSGRNRFALQGEHARSAFVDPTSRLRPDGR
jgi:hypothetical protein